MLVPEVISPVELMDAMVVAPYLMTNFPATSSMLKFAVANFVAVAALPVVLWFSVGMSEATIARNVGTPAEPFGDAKK